MRKIVIKEGPLVFLRNLLVMEIIATAFIVGASYLAHYEELLRNWGVLQFIRFDILVLVLFALFQITYIVALFFDWYFTYFEVKESEITKKSGLMFRRRKSVVLTDVTTVEVYQSPFGRLMHHATIIIEHGNSRVTKIKNVSNVEENVAFIKQAIKSVGRVIPINSVTDLIKNGESKSIEFKETLRYDVRKKEVSKDVEKSSLKSIVGFLNAEGGTLVIGVNDDKKITGIELDYNNLPKKNRDGFENHINMSIKNMIGLSFSKYISIDFETIDSKEVCIINVMPSHKPAYLTNYDGKEEFFVRVNNSTQPFSMSQAEEYIKSKW
jgi:membrane protein YdbS with pleckstrin-like domain